MNTLFYGDNLQVLRAEVKDESVDLIYLDPPFNSKRDYNLLFKSPKGEMSEAQIAAFEDTWHWNQQAEREFDELLHQPNTDVAEMMKSLRSFLGENDMMAYLTMMANRLLELHRVLRSTGSLYLHCDPTASHYLRVVLDGVFGKTNMRNEIIWRRTTAHNDPKRFGTIHDTIFYYVKKVGSAMWNAQFSEYTEDYIERYFKYRDPDGRRYWANTLTAPGPRPNLEYEWKGVFPPKGRCWSMEKEKLEELDKRGGIHYSKSGFPLRKYYLDEMKGVPVQDLWTDINRVGAFGADQSEKLGYPTQKPLALLERIVVASSNVGDTVLDPFCGCGTAVHAAQKLGRKWIGIDITCLAIGLIERRLKDAFGESCKFTVKGTPTDLESASDLAIRDRYQFQWWAVTLVGAQPYQGKKKGADTGIDGLKFFHDIEGEAKKIVVSVKSGKLKADDVRAMMAVREREKAEIAILISLNNPTPKMKADAASAGLLHAGPHGSLKFPRIQLLTIEGLLSGAERAEHPDYVPDVNYKKAKKEKRDRSKSLFEE